MRRQQTRTNRQLRRRGFTLLEVLLVLAILGVIAAMVVPRLIGSQQTAMIDTTKASIHGLSKTMDLYAVDHDGTYPESIEDLLTPIDRDENPMQPYLKSMPEDAWGTVFNYKPEVNESMASMVVVKIWSNGPDRNDDDGSGDDINNWDEDNAE